MIQCLQGEYMVFSVQKRTLTNCLSAAMEATNKGSSSVVGTVLFTLSGNTLTVAATDVKVYYKSSITVDGSKDGVVAVFCDKIMAVLSNLPDEIVKLAYDDGKMVLKPSSKKATYKLPTLSAETFPERFVTTPVESFTIDANVLRRLVAHTIFSVSDDITRAFMNGVCFEAVDNVLTCIATDGRRLQLSRAAVQCADFANVIAPPKVLQIVAKQANGDVQVTISGKDITFTFGESVVNSVLVDGQYPNYRKVIPESQAHKLTVGLKDLAQAIKRVSVMIEDKSARIVLSMTSTSLVVNAGDGGAGEAVEELEAKSTADCVIGFNYNYLLDALKVIDGDADIEFTESNKAVTIAHGETLTVIMPQQVNQ